MLKKNVVEQLNSLRLRGLLEAYQEQLENPHYRDLSFEERFAFLVDREAMRRSNGAFQRRLRLATLRNYASIEEVDLKLKRNLTKSQLLEFAQPSWIQNHFNLIVTGPTGMGKTFIASALGYNACKLGFNVRYLKLHELLIELSVARHDGNTMKFAKELSKTDLLIIDEWLRESLTQSQATELLDLIDLRFRRASTLFISQLPVEDWHAAISNPTLADAILDRIVHDALRIKLHGESVRKSTSLLAKKPEGLTA